MVKQRALRWRSRGRSDQDAAAVGQELFDLIFGNCEARGRRLSVCFCCMAARTTQLIELEIEMLQLHKTANRRRYGACEPQETRGNIP